MTYPIHLFAKKSIYIVISYLRKGRFHICGFLLFHLGKQTVKYRLQFIAGLLDAEPYQPQGRSRIEHNNKDYTLPYNGYVDIVLFPLVKKDGKLLFPYQLGQPPCCGNVPCCKGGK